MQYVAPIQAPDCGAVGKLQGTASQCLARVTYILDLFAVLSSRFVRRISLVDRGPAGNIQSTRSDQTVDAQSRHDQDSLPTFAVPCTERRRIRREAFLGQLRLDDDVDASYTSA